MTPKNDNSDFVPRPIDTKYDGHRFRSRLEARWAVFFNQLGIEYVYEPEGVEFEDGGMYLPDFYLPTVSNRSTEKSGMWVEIKGKATFDSWSDEPFESLQKLASMTGEPAALLVGGVGNSPGDKENPEYHFEITPEYGVDNWMYWAKCRQCGRIKLEFNELNYMGCESCSGTCEIRHPDIQEAVKAAKMARFEHGETPENRN